jgi:hypothetical protein
MVSILFVSPSSDAWRWWKVPTTHLRTVLVDIHTGDILIPIAYSQHDRRLNTEKRLLFGAEKIGWVFDQALAGTGSSNYPLGGR